MRSILRWAGSKRKLLVPLEKMWLESGSETYIEPFCGSACLFFHTEPQNAILADTNEWLISTYRALQTEPNQVVDKLYSLIREKKLYNKIRTIHFSRFSEVNKAAYFIYLNRLCFNGLFRTNKNQIFNVPYSNYKTGEFPSRKLFLKSSSLLKRSQLYSSDFSQTIMDHVKKNNFVYLDPPYATNNMRIFRQYNSSTFGVNDIERLDNALDFIDKIGAKFVLSYANTDEIKFISKKWKTETVSVIRNISGFSNKRKIASEIFVKNF